jgi:hypothetical protein
MDNSAANFLPTDWPPHFEPEDSSRTAHEPPVDSHGAAFPVASDLIPFAGSNSNHHRAVTTT